MTRDEKSDRKSEELKPARAEEARRVVEEYANGLREIIEKLRRRADSDDLARVYRFDLAQDSEMISPTIAI